jgi:acetyl esterase/lipase
MNTLLLASLFLTTFLGSFSVMAQDNSAAKSPQGPPSLKDLIEKRMVLHVPGMENAKTRKDLTYKRVGNEELKMDVYSPSTSTGAKLPAILFIHGGPLPTSFPLPPREWGVFVSYGQYAAASGFIGVTFNHRFHAPENMPDAQSDIDEALRYVVEHADSLGIDKDRIALWVFSGGGPFLSHFLRNPSPSIRCIVAFYTILDVRPFRAQSPGVSEETLYDFSPVFALTESKGKIPPIFIGRAGLDNAVLNSTIDAFVAAALKNNLTIDVSNHAAGHHAFDIREDDARSREIIRHAMAFIQAHI